MRSISAKQDFTRGGQIVMHSIRMVLQAWRYVIRLTVICFVVVLIGLWWVNTKPMERQLLWLQAKAYGMESVGILLNEKQKQIKIVYPHGRQVLLKADLFLKHPATTNNLMHCKQVLLQCVLQALSASLLVVVLLIWFFYRKGGGMRQRSRVRGSHLVEPKILKKIIVKARQQSNLHWSKDKIPLIQDSEVQNTLIVGSIGTGKTVAMLELMQQVRKQGQRAIVYDRKGVFASIFYRPGQDIILNPLDSRSPAWDLWAECHDMADYEAIANALMPLHLSNSDPFWINSARIIFATAARKMKEQGCCDTRALLSQIFSDIDDNNQLANLLKGTEAETLVSEKVEKMALSIKATLSTYCKSLLYLPEIKSNGTTFSIRDWVNNEQQDSWIFITVADRIKMDALRPLISVWLDVAVKSILTLPLNRQRRLWSFFDELASIHQLPSLEMALSEGREYGSCMAIAIQDVHQIRAIYGNESSESLLSLFNTDLFLRTNTDDTARWMANIMGRQEILEHKESYSYGANDIRDGVSIHQERRTDPIVLDSEFLSLNNLEGYLRLPGRWPLAKVQFVPKNYPSTQPAFVKRKIIETNLVLPTPKSEAPTDKIVAATQTHVNETKPKRGRPKKNTEKEAAC